MVREIVQNISRFERAGVVFRLGKKHGKAVVFVSFAVADFKGVDDVLKFVRNNKAAIIKILRKRFSRSEREATDDFVGDLFFSHPGEVAESIDRYNSRRLPGDPGVIEFILQNLESEALEVLHSDGVECLADALDLEKDQDTNGPLDREKLAAVLVLRDAWLVRTDADIKTGEACQVAVRMVQIMANALKFAYSGTLFTGLRIEHARKSSKERPRLKRASQGIELLILEIISDFPNKSNVWIKNRMKRMLKECSWTGSKQEIDYEISIEWDSDDEPFLKIERKTKDRDTETFLKFSTIEKKYIPDVKKRYGY